MERTIYGNNTEVSELRSVKDWHVAFRPHVAIFFEVRCGDSS